MYCYFLLCDSFVWQDENAVYVLLLSNILFKPEPWQSSRLC